MSQLPDAFKGHDLTGWSLGLNDPETLTYFRRMTAIGPTIIRLRFTHNTSGLKWMPECELLNQEVLHYGGFEFEEAIKIANEWASREQFGGWAPAPIGSDPGWRYDVEAVPDYQTVQVSYHFGEGDPTPPMVYRKAQRNKAGVWKFYDGHGWELLHGIVYAWREEPGVDPAPPEAKP